MNVITLGDGCVRVCLEAHGITACTTVSSHHLVEDKFAQLQAAIERQRAGITLPDRLV